MYMAMEERLLAYMPPGKILNNLSTKQQEKQKTIYSNMVAKTKQVLINFEQEGDQNQNPVGWPANQCPAALLRG